MIECEFVFIDFRVALFHISMPLSMFANVHLRGGGSQRPDENNLVWYPMF